LGGEEGADGAEREKFHEEEYRIQNIEYRRLLAEMECHCDFRVPGGDWGFGEVFEGFLEGFLGVYEVAGGD
jgi:hypothetical protein